MIIARTHSFSIRPGKTKKPWDSNETLQRKGEKATENKEEKGGNMGCEYLDAVKAAAGTANPLGSRIQGPTVQHG